jgi:hypothetical protein
MAVGMDDPQVGGVVRAPLVLGHHMVDVERLAMFESLVTAGAPPLLAPGESPVAIRRRTGACFPLSPAVLKGRVIGGIGLGDEPMAHHPCPGECPEGGMARFILQDPAVPPGSHGPAPHTSGVSTSLIGAGGVASYNAARERTCRCPGR